jgi:putative transposase
LRKKPSDGGIVERPFGTFNTEFFSTLPGYTTRELGPQRAKAESEACLTLDDLEKLFVRYVVDRYNQQADARIGTQSRLDRWIEGRRAEPTLVTERDLDVLLMRQARRRVYRHGYVKFSNLVYRGEYLAGFAGENVVLRYDPRDITQILIYQQQDLKDVFLTRAYAQGLNMETLSLSDAKEISRSIRLASSEVTNQSMLAELQDRQQYIERVQQRSISKESMTSEEPEQPEEPQWNEEVSLPEVRVYDLDE